MAKATVVTRKLTGYGVYKPMTGHPDRFAICTALRFMPRSLLQARLATFAIAPFANLVATVLRGSGVSVIATMGYAKRLRLVLLRVYVRCGVLGIIDIHLDLFFRDLRVGGCLILCRGIAAIIDCLQEAGRRDEVQAERVCKVDEDALRSTDGDAHIPLPNRGNRVLVWLKGHRHELLCWLR